MADCRPSVCLPNCRFCPHGYLIVGQSVCLSIYRSFCFLSVCPSFCLLAYETLSACLIYQDNPINRNCLSTCLSIYLSVYLPIFMSICLPRLSVWLPICLSLCSHNPITIHTSCGRRIILFNSGIPVASIERKILLRCAMIERQWALIEKPKNTKEMRQQTHPRKLRAKSTWPC